MVKNQPYNAGDEGSPPVRELRSHAVGLNPHAPTTEPEGPQLERGPHTTTEDSA